MVLFSMFIADGKAQFAIIRGERDVFHNTSSCTRTPDYCYGLNADASHFDSCICRCKQGYPMYRNPDVFPDGGVFKSRNTPGCSWHSNHRGGRASF